MTDEIDKIKQSLINRNCLHCNKAFVVEKPCKTNRFCTRNCYYKYATIENAKNRDSLIPEIKQYRATHTANETAKKFGISEGAINRWGIHGPEKLRRLLCPNELTVEQKETIFGNLLGDGSIGYIKDTGGGRGGYNCKFSIGQKIDRIEYIKALFDTYNPFSCSLMENNNRRKPSKLNGKINHDKENWNGEYTHNVCMQTVSHPIFTELRKQWYKEPYLKNSSKIVPNDLCLTWRMAAIWMCDDGSNHLNDIIKNRNYGSRHLTLHTESFTKSDVEFLLDRLRIDLSILGTINRHVGHYTVRIGGDEWFKFIENIKPFIPWQCFQYKCASRDKICCNTSGVVGVRFCDGKGKWHAYGRSRKKRWDKYFDTFEEAVKYRKNKGLLEN